MFESEYQEMKKRPLNVEWLMMDSVILLPPTGTPMTGIEFTKRLPCGELLMVSVILLPPTGTPMTGIEFTKCHPVERSLGIILLPPTGTPMTGIEFTKCHPVERSIGSGKFIF
ncbi:Protein CL16A [Homalodisca vitripennis]|nr:Protein CL16A [Homalodisca vitripennis]